MVFHVKYIFLPPKSEAHSNRLRWEWDSETSGENIHLTCKNHTKRIFSHTLYSRCINHFKYITQRVKSMKTMRDGFNSHQFSEYGNVWRMRECCFSVWTLPSSPDFFTCENVKLSNFLWGFEAVVFFSGDTITQEISINHQIQPII